MRPKGLASFRYEGSACRLSEEQQEKLKTWMCVQLRLSRGMDAAHAAPPAQIRACAANALGSCLGCLTSKR